MLEIPTQIEEVCWNFWVVVELVGQGDWESMLEKYVGNADGVWEKYELLVRDGLLFQCNNRIY